MDEDPVIKEIAHKAKWDIKQKVTETQAANVFKRMGTYFRDKFRDGDADAHLFIRIKTAAGQIKRTEVMNVEESTLEQAFVHNEIIDKFKHPLTQRYDGLRDDVVKKILEIPDRLDHKDEECDDA